MSHLSPQECTAGISRAALATLRKHGSNGDSPHAAPTKPVAPVAQTSNVVRSIGAGTQEIPVLETPYRRLSLLELPDEKLLLRDACFIGSKCDVQLIHLERHEAHALAAVLVKVEADQAAPEDVASKQRVRVRA